MVGGEADLVSLSPLLSALPRSATCCGSTGNKGEEESGPKVHGKTSCSVMLHTVEGLVSCLQDGPLCINR